jgi:hypothetical protein
MLLPHEAHDDQRRVEQRSLVESRDRGHCRKCRPAVGPRSILLALIVWHFLAAIPLKLYLAIIVVILLVLVFRKRSVAN